MNNMDQVMAGPVSGTYDLKLQAIKALAVAMRDSKQFVLTGSYAMSLIGLANKSNDVDITIVGLGESSKAILAEYTEKYPIHKNINERLIAKGLYAFIINDVKFNVFVTETSLYDERLRFDGVVISPVNRCVAAKKSYGRLKDLAQLKEWADEIMSSSYFMANLNSAVSKAASGSDNY